MPNHRQTNQVRNGFTKRGLHSQEKINMHKKRPTCTKRDLQNLLIRHVEWLAESSSNESIKNWIYNKRPSYTKRDRANKKTHTSPHLFYRKRCVTCQIIVKQIKCSTYTKIDIQKETYMHNKKCAYTKRDLYIQKETKQTKGNTCLLTYFDERDAWYTKSSSNKSSVKNIHDEKYIYKKRPTYTKRCISNKKRRIIQQETYNPFPTYRPTNEDVHMNRVVLYVYKKRRNI